MSSGRAGNHSTGLAYFGLLSAEEQDYLWRITLPHAERENVLRRLDKFNLNAYSLLGSEEALMEVMAARELYRVR